MSGQFDAGRRRGRERAGLTFITTSPAEVMGGEQQGL
jgi:hypothetical protein